MICRNKASWSVWTSKSSTDGRRDVAAKTDQHRFKIAILRLFEQIRDLTRNILLEILCLAFGLLDLAFDNIADGNDAVEFAVCAAQANGETCWRTSRPSPHQPLNQVCRKSPFSSCRMKSEWQVQLRPARNLANHIALGCNAANIPVRFRE